MSETHSICQTSVRDLSLSLSGSSILHNISFDLFCHQFCAIIGPNGAGKSTLLRCLTGELKGKGTIYFKNKKESPRIGYVPQKLSFEKDNPITPLDLFLLIHTKGPIWLPHKSLERKKFYDALVTVKAEHLIERKMATLSGGEQRRIVLALAIANNPEVLLLDEPDAGVDQKGLHLFYSILWELKKSYDVSILMVSHDFDLIKEHADRILLLSQGRLVKEGKPQDIFASPAFKELFQ